MGGVSPNPANPPPVLPPLEVSGSDGASNLVAASGKSSTLHVSVALSTIIASIWAGVWGFDWAATHLPGGLLFLAIIVGLSLGALLTAYVSHEAFEIMRESIRLSTVNHNSDVDAAVQVLSAERPPPLSGWLERADRNPTKPSH